MAPAGASGAATPQVLLVEDDASLRAALSFALEIEGFRVETRDSGEALLERPVPAGPACLVVDLRLPGISGLEALALLRKRRILTPAILITTQPDAAARAAAAALQVRIVEKPLIGDALVEAIREALG